MIRKAPILVVLVLFLGACAQLSDFLGAAAPETPRQRLAAAETAFIAVVETATILRDRGVIGDEQAARVTRVVKTVDAALDEAQAAILADNRLNFDSWLAIAMTGIAELNSTMEDLE